MCFHRCFVGFSLDELAQSLGHIQLIYQFGIDCVPRQELGVMFRIFVVLSTAPGPGLEK